MHANSCRSNWYVISRVIGCGIDKPLSSFLLPQSFSDSKGKSTNNRGYSNHPGIKSNNAEFNFGSASLSIKDAYSIMDYHYASEGMVTAPEKIITMPDKLEDSICRVFFSPDRCLLYLE